MMANGRMDCLMAKENLFMMMGPCTRDVSSKDMPNVCRQFTFTTLAHFIEGRSKTVKLTDRVNCPRTSSILRESGPKTYPMEREGKYTDRIPITRVILFKEERKDWGFTIGVQKSITQDNL